MNWPIFAVFAYIALALEGGLRALLSIPDAATGVSPQFLLILLMWVGLMAPARTVAGAALVLGLLADLQGNAVPGGPIIGPSALGFLVGGYATVQLRSLVFRQSTLTLCVTTLVSGILVHIVIVALLWARGLGWLTDEPIQGFTAAEQFVRRFLMLLYTAVAAVPVGMVLFRTLPLWGFTSKGRSH